MLDEPLIAPTGQVLRKRIQQPEPSVHLPQQRQSAPPSLENRLGVEGCPDLATSDERELDLPASLRPQSGTSWSWGWSRQPTQYPKSPAARYISLVSGANTLSFQHETCRSTNRVEKRRGCAVSPRPTAADRE